MYPVLLCPALLRFSAAGCSLVERVREWLSLVYPLPQEEVGGSHQHLTLRRTRSPSPGLLHRHSASQLPGETARNEEPSGVRVELNGWTGGPPWDWDWDWGTMKDEEEAFLAHTSCIKSCAPFAAEGT